MKCGEKKNVPNLRFKEFNDEYNALKLSDVAELTSSKRIYLSDYTDNGIPFYRGKEISELKLNKPVSDLLYISDEKYKEIEAKYGVPKENDILVTGVGTLGNIYRIPNNNKFYFKDGNLIWLKNIKQNSEYLEYNLEFNKKKLLDSAIGSTQKALTIAGLNKLSFFYPSTSEQSKVARTMQLIDIKINLQSKKIEDLKLFKKGLSKYIFNLLTKYEKIKLENACDIVTGKLDANAMVENGKYRFYTCAKEYYMIDKYAYDTEALLISGNGAYVGYIHYYNGKFNAYQRTYILHNFKYNVQYIKCYLDEYLSEKINLEKKDGNTPYIVLSTLSDMIIKIPSSFEQLKISKIINICNCKLEIEKNKLIKLKELKKGLMQNMFV